MKAFLLSTCMIVITGSAIAQEQHPAPVRETLFGKDYKTQIQQQNNDNSKTVNPGKTVSSTRAAIFTDYHQPSARSAARKASSSKQAAATPLPSEISAKDAAAKAPKTESIKPPVTEQDPSNAPSAKSTPAAKKN